MLRFISFVSVLYLFLACAASRGGPAGYLPLFGLQVQLSLYVELLRIHVFRNVFHPLHNTWLEIRSSSEE